jgi:hypothetical protein
MGIGEEDISIQWEVRLKDAGRPVVLSRDLGETKNHMLRTFGEPQYGIDPPPHHVTPKWIIVKDQNGVEHEVDVSFHWIPQNNTAIRIQKAVEFAKGKVEINKIAEALANNVASNNFGPENEYPPYLRVYDGSINELSS